MMKAVALLFLLCYFQRISWLSGVVLCLLYYLVDAVLEHQVHRISGWVALQRLGELSATESEQTHQVPVSRQRYLFNV